MFQKSDKGFTFNDFNAYHIQQLRYKQSLFLNSGVRYANFFGELGDDDETTYDVGAAYVLPWTRTKLRGSFSTSFTRNTNFVFNRSPDAPLDFEQFGGTETRNWEVGFDQPLFGDRVLLQFTYFELDKKGTPRTIRDPLTNTTFFVNDDNSENKGVEFFVEARPLETVRFTGSVAHIESEITKSGTRPKEVGFNAIQLSDMTASIGADWVPFPNIRIGTLAVYQSEQKRDTFAPFGLVTLLRPAFWRWNAYAEYAFTPSIQAGIRIENILGERNPAASAPRIGTPSLGGKDPGTIATFSLRYRF